MSLAKKGMNARIIDISNGNNSSILRGETYAIAEELHRAGGLTKKALTELAHKYF